MTVIEKRDFLINKVLSRKEKNRYSQDVSKRTLIEKGFGDCSGTVWYWYYKLFSINIGTNTEAQIKSSVGKILDIDIIDGIPDESKMRKGDLIFFRGTDKNRTKGVGHVEMYIGDGKIFGHGSGVGGTVKNMKKYCRKRFETPSVSPLNNKGAICVKRYIFDEDDSMIEELTDINDIVWEFAHRGIITDSDLWLEKMEADKNSYWLARKALHALRCTEEKNN